MPKLLQSISIALLLLFNVLSTQAKSCSFPQKEGDKARYSVQIDFKKAYISGVGVMAMQDEVINCSVFNEFGVSAFAFSFNPQKNKVKILHLISKMNKWYIKKVLKHDLRQMMHMLPDGETTYKNEKFNITYTFTPLEAENETTE